MFNTGKCYWMGPWLKQFRPWKAKKFISKKPVWYLAAHFFRVRRNRYGIGKVKPYFASQQILKERKNGCQMQFFAILCITNVALQVFLFFLSNKVPNYAITSEKTNLAGAYLVFSPFLLWSQVVSGTNVTIFECSSNDRLWGKCKANYYGTAVKS